MRLPLLTSLIPGKKGKPALQPGWLVFARDAHGLRWLHLVRSADHRPRVLAWESIPAGSELPEQMGKLSLRGHLRRYRCLAVLQGDEYQIVQAELPSVPAEEMRQALRWSVREQLDYPVDDLGIDYLEVPGDKQRGGASKPAYMICAKRVALDRYVNAFAAVKAHLHVGDVVETAHRNIAALCDKEGHGTALLSVMFDHCLLSFTHDGELCMSRRIDVGLLALERAVGEARQSLYDHILLELQRSLDAFERQFHFAPLSRLLVSPLPENIDLQPFLIDNLYQRVEALDLSQLFDFSAVEDLTHPANLAACLSLLGAGLRDEDALEPT